MRLSLITNFLLGVLFYREIQGEASFINFTNANCQTTVLCTGYSPMDEGYCIIWYRRNIAYVESFGLPINSSINSLVTLPQMQPNTSYLFHILVLISNSTAFQIFEGAHITGEFDGRLTLINKVVLSVASVLWTLAAILTGILAVLQLKLTNERNVKVLRLSKLFATCSSVTMFLSLPLWVALGLLVALQTNTCDLVWKMRRDGIIFYSLILPLVSIVLAIVSAVLLTISFHHVITLVRRHPSVIHREEIVMQQCEVFAYCQGSEHFIVKANPLYGYTPPTIPSRTTSISLIPTSIPSRTTDTACAMATANSNGIITGQCDSVLRNQHAL